MTTSVPMDSRHRSRPRPGTARPGDTFPIGELVALSGTPATTIHHYRRLGLLPPALEPAPNRFLYDERHLQALQLIKVLRQRRRLSLDDIAEILPGLLADREEAFRPEMWDAAITELRAAASGTPASRLLEAAIRAFARHGYAEVGVGDVSSAAGLAKGTVYRHFPSKEELFFAAAEQLVADVTARFDHEAAGAGHALSADKAAEVLVTLIGPGLPLLLELVTGALQRRAGYERASRRALGTLAAHVGRRVAGVGDPGERGVRVLTLAAQHAVRSGLGL